MSHLVTHADRHVSGAADAIKLDDLAAPDDNTDLNASATRHGLLPKLSNVVTEFLTGTGTWAVPGARAQAVAYLRGLDFDAASLAQTAGVQGVVDAAQGDASGWAVRVVR